MEKYTQDINIIYSIEYPEINDEFATKLGQKSVEALKDILMTNLKQEAESKEDQRIEAELLEKVILASEFSEVPDVLITSEKQKMFHELKHSLEEKFIVFGKMCLFYKHILLSKLWITMCIC